MVAERKRTLKVKIHHVEAQPSWGNSILTVEQYNPARSVHIVIEDPADLNYLRTALDKIEENWHERLAAQGMVKK